MSATEPTFGEVAHLLGGRMLDLCAVLGLDGARQGDLLTPRNPTRADRHPGSFVIHVSGHKAGRWDDYATHDHGDALDLVAYVRLGRLATTKADKSEAYRWAVRWLGLGEVGRLGDGGTAKMARLREEMARKTADAEASLQRETGRKRRGAKAMWLEARPLAAPARGEAPSPAWAYLAEARGIPLHRLPRLPAAVRWTPRAKHVETEREVPALVSGIYAPGGELVAVHRVFLEPDGSGKLRCPDPATPVKKIWPAGWRGGFIPLARGAGDLPVKAAAERGARQELYLCEGVEDGLTAAALVPEWRVWAVATGGNFAEVAPPACAGAVIAGRDNDVDRKARAALDRSLAALRERCTAAGLDLYVTRAQGGAKDFNDMIRPEAA